MSWLVCARLAGTVTVIQGIEFDTLHSSRAAFEIFTVPLVAPGETEIMEGLTVNERAALPLNFRERVGSEEVVGFFLRFLSAAKLDVGRKNVI